MKTDFLQDKKTHYLKVLIIFTLLGSSICLLTQCANKQSDYNLLFISIDTLRADHLGYSGYQRNTSPYIDAFAKKNITFNNFYTVVPKTGPSMTSFFTGRYIQNHGVVMNHLKKDPTIKTFTQLLPDTFKKAAFIANPVLNKKRGYADGFTDFSVSHEKYLSHDELSQKGLSYSAINWLKKLTQKDKFFLWVHYLDPHGPYRPPQEFNELFVNDKFYDETRKVTLDYIPEDPKAENVVLGAVPRYQRLSDIDEADYYTAQYDAEIRYTDREVNKLLDFLEAQELMEKTIIVITADHGESLGEHNYYFEHGMLVNEGSIHIPLIIHHPDIKKPLSVNSFLQNIDLAPTLLSEYGLKFQEPVDGLNFREIYHGNQPNEELRDYVYSCTTHDYKNYFETIRTPDQKLIRINEKEYEYFDLKNDPFEEHNLVTNPNFDHNQMRNEITLFQKFGKSAHRSATDVKIDKETMKGLKELGYAK